MEKIDPYKHKERYLKWKETLHEGITGISKENVELLLQYISDMETGLNIAIHHKKGSRSFIRLNTLRTRLYSLMRDFEQRFRLAKINGVNL